MFTKTRYTHQFSMSQEPFQRHKTVNCKSINIVNKLFYDWWSLHLQPKSGNPLQETSGGGRGLLWTRFTEAQHLEFEADEGQHLPSLRRRYQRWRTARVGGRQKAPMMELCFASSSSSSSITQVLNAGEHELHEGKHRLLDISFAAGRQVN